MKLLLAVRALRARPIAVLATLIVVAASANALLVGCGGKSQESSQQEQSSAGQTNTATSTTPPATTAGSGDLGVKVYTERCVLCHGPEGKGNGPGAAGLDPKPRDHTNGAYMNARTNDQLIEVIKNGKGNMPAWGSVLNDQEIHAVLRHVRSLAQPPYTGPMP